MQTFAEATALRPQGGAFTADLDPQWAVGDKLHGGYLMAVLGRAVAAVSPHPHLNAISAVFLRPPLPGPATVSVEELRAGRGASQYRARLEQDGVPSVEAHLTQSTLAGAEPWWSAAPQPGLPPEEECVHFPSNPPGASFPVPLLDVVEHRLDPSALGFVRGVPSQKGEVSAWLRLADGSDWDPLGILVALDMAPPVALTLGLTGWAPTLSLTAYLRRLPAPGPLRVTMTATEIGGGRMDETVWVWDAAGALVAQGTQLAAVRA